jgi:hypothetical protein
MTSPALLSSSICAVAASVVLACGGLSASRGGTEVFGKEEPVTIPAGDSYVVTGEIKPVGAPLEVRLSVKHLRGGSLKVWLLDRKNFDQFNSLGNTSRFAPLRTGPDGRLAPATLQPIAPGLAASGVTGIYESEWVSINHTGLVYLVAENDSDRDARVIAQAHLRRRSD